MLATTAMSSNLSGQDYSVATPKTKLRMRRAQKEMSSGKDVSHLSGHGRNLPQINEMNQALTFGKGTKVEFNKTVNWQGAKNPETGNYNDIDGVIGVQDPHYRTVKGLESTFKKQQRTFSNNKKAKVTQFNSTGVKHEH